MPPELCRLTSFNPDLDDWYSCHTSDDEAYQDALERNSVASFYTARGGGSTAASLMYTSITISSPARLADADQALAEMVPEPIGDQRQQHDPPELDEDDAPVLKRTRSSAPLPSAPSPPRIITTPSSRAKVVSRVSARRGYIFRAVTPTTLCAPLTTGPQPAAVTAGPLRVCISVLPGNASVRVQFLSTIFCFGDVPLPLTTGNTDYAAVLMGPDDGIVAEDSFPVKTSPAHGYVEPLTPTAEPLATAKLDADCSVKLLTRRRGETPCKVDNPKDQNNVKSQAAGKLRKQGSGFPGSLLQRLFSGMRSSRGGTTSSNAGDEGSLPAATVHELGSELLMASTATAAADLATAAQVNPVLAGYVQMPVPATAAEAIATATVPASTPPRNGTLDTGMLDEAAVAAQRLSAEIIRNVLRVSADGSGSASTPKALLSPRDTAFPSAEAQTLQRDQLITETTAGRHLGLLAGADVQGDSSLPETPSHQSVQSPDRSKQHPSSPGVMHDLLTNLASVATEVEPAAPGISDLSKSIVQEAVEDTVAASADGELAKVASDVKIEGKMTPTFSVEGLALDCGGLPMPELEQCESPVAVSTLATGAAAIMEANTNTADVGEQDTTHEHAVAKVERTLAAADTSSATTSPRTVSKRAYGTVARLVKKIVPGFRDTAMMSTSASIQASTVAASTEVIAPVEAGIDEPQEQQSEDVSRVVDDRSKAVQAGVGAVVTMERVPAAKKQPTAELTLGAAVTVVAQDESGVEDTDIEAVSKRQAKEAAGGEAAATPFFVFGQEQVKSAKHGVAKALSFTTQTAASPPSVGDHLAQPIEAACRKRKAVDEILPSAKQPVFDERSTSKASEEDLIKSPLTDTVKASQIPTDQESRIYLQEAKDFTSSSPTRREAAVKQETSLKFDGCTSDAGEHEAQAVVEAVSPNRRENVPRPYVVAGMQAEDVSALSNLGSVAAPSSIVPAAAIPAESAVESDSQSIKSLVVEAVAAECGAIDVLMPHAVPVKAIPVADGKEDQDSTSLMPTAAATLSPYSPGAVQTDKEPIRSPAAKPSLEMASTKPATENVEAAEVSMIIVVPQQDLASASSTVAIQIMASPKTGATSSGKEVAAAQTPEEGDPKRTAGAHDVQTLASVQDGSADIMPQSEPEACANQQSVAHETPAAMVTEPRHVQQLDAVAVAALPNTEIEAGMPEVPIPVSEVQAARAQPQASGNATVRMVDVQSAKMGEKHKRRGSGFSSFFNCFKV